MQNVTAYYRFSDPSQGAGKSIQRQSEDCEAYARDHGWTITTILQDDGRSGFFGKNRGAGTALGDYEIEVGHGLHHGSILLVERLDRLSRQGHRRTFDLIHNLTDNGVSVATVDGGEFFEASVELDMFQVIKILMKAELARDESLNKSKKGKRNHDIRRTVAQANKTAVTMNVAPWIKVADDRTMTLDANRAALLLDIFNMADGGLGAQAISKELVRRKVPLWTARTKRPALIWQRTVIDKMLKNRAAIGEFQPTRIIDGKRQPFGPPWQNHFPQAIPVDLFDRVNAGAKVRKDSARGQRDDKVSNLFSGIAYCSHCGSTLRYQRGRASGAVITTKNGLAYTYSRDNGSLVCPVGVVKGNDVCPNSKYLAYLTFEHAVLRSALHLVMDDNAFSREDEVGRLNIAIAEEQRSLTLATEAFTNFANAYAAKASELRLQMMDDAETKVEELTANIKAMTSKREEAKGKVSSAAHLARVSGMLDNLYHEDLTVRVPIRKKIAQALRHTIHSIKLDQTGVATVVLDGGLVVFEVHKKEIRPVTDTLAGLMSGAIPLPRSGNRMVQGQIEARMKKARD